jgi:hypothetical protein
MTKNINKQMKKDSRHCSNVIVGEREEKKRKIVFEERSYTKSL